MYKMYWIVITLLIICGCNKTESSVKNSPVNKIVAKSNLEEDFGKFYKKFYSDSCFQISRIAFPLPGDNTDVMNRISVENQVTDEYIVKDSIYFWQKKGWTFLRTIFGKDEILVKTIKKDGSVIREQLRAKDYDLVITREFSLKENKWMLIYYGNECY